ncbi:MAG: hypothetical protein RL637_663 [Pseudomonadota bacterium]|jgi:twitching motility protein PilJ
MLEQLKEIFLDIRIIYKFLLVFSMMIIGSVLVAYTFQKMLNEQRDLSTQLQTQSQNIQQLASIQITILTQLSSSNYSSQSATEKQQFFKIVTEQLTTQFNQLKITEDSQLWIKLKKTFADYQNYSFDHNPQIPLIEFSKPLLQQLDSFKQNQTKYYQQQFDDLTDSYYQSQQLFYATLSLVVLVVISILWFVVAQGILEPISYLQSTINEIAAGNLEARVDGVGHDEIGKLAQAFDALLDERATSFARTEYDHHQLNTSIINLLRSVSVLSQKDLTIVIPVAEDMTGAVSDAINLLTSEIAATLTEVRLISAKVNDVSDQVKQQSNRVMDYADNQRREIDVTLEELNGVVNTMIKIAKFSQVTDQESEKTMHTTESAVEAVSQTVASINSIRDIIRETEKRIKRLGERSQEITSVVNIINNIAERTHVLSLNAGMQAAAAGEAGKGFMVIANEVQRLAESSREATEKIATLVKNIQIDTSDTMKTMNTVITQVVDGTQQAEEAGKRMKESQLSTQSLVNSVKKIAASTISQLTVGRSLKEHAQNIQQSTIKTNEQLKQQRQLSDDLAHYAAELIVKVGIFKLPK